MDSDNLKKNVDGVKKPNREKLVKSREIVLDIIGEGVKKATENKASENIISKKVDGIAPKIFNNQENTIDFKEKVTAEKKAGWRKELSKILPNETKPVSQAKTPLNEKYTTPAALSDKKPDYVAPDFTKDVAGEGDTAPVTPPTVKSTEKNPKLNKVVSMNQKIKLVEEAKKNLETKKRMEQTRAKRRLEFETAKKAKLEEKRKKRAAILASWKRSLKELPIKLNEALKASIYIFFFALILLFLLYSILSISELKFDADNKILRVVSRYFPVPAIITKYGMIEYYKYKDIFTTDGSVSSVASPAEAIKIKIARYLIYLNLLERYHLTYSDQELSLDETMLNKLSPLIINDNMINQVGFERIKKIKQLINEKGDFVQVARKYGDELGQATITDENKDSYLYYSQVKNLNKDEISEIIYTPIGYYIFRCYEKNDDHIALSYAFVRAVTLEKYIEETAQNLKMWSLVK